MFEFTYEGIHRQKKVSKKGEMLECDCFRGNTYPVQISPEFRACMNGNSFSSMGREVGAKFNKAQFLSD